MSQETIDNIPTDKLKEKIKQCQEYLQKMERELENRKQNTSLNISSTGKLNTLPNELHKSKSQKSKPKKTINTTNTTIKKVLNEEGIEHKTSAKKEELEGIVRKNGLVHKVKNNDKNIDKKPKLLVTMSRMKEVLDENKIKYNNTAKKIELENLIRKNNLVKKL